MIYQSGNFSLDTQSYVFKRDGKKLQIEPQVFDLLVHLIENRDRVVTRNELLSNLWNGRIVTESALNGRLKIARKAVGDNGKQQRIIKTIHRRGYQFIADVSVASETGVRASLPGELQPMATTKPSVALLPFENLGKAEDSDYFADGLTMDINANLSRYRELLVIDSHSAFAFREGYSSAESFAREIGVQYLVSGGVRQSSNRVRISTRLVEAATGKLIWGDNLERTYDDIFSLEAEVASKIASSLASHIEEESSARAAKKPPESMTAFDCVLRARQFEESYEKYEIETARSFLERAIESDPSYAAAYTWFAHSYVKEADSEWCESRTQALSQGVELARKAVTLDEYDAYAHTVLGWAYMSLGNFDLAEIHLDRAIECNPNEFDAYCVKAWLLAFNGHAAEVDACGTRALQINPLVPDQCLAAITTARYTEGNYTSALDMLGRIRDPSEQSEALRAACLVQMGRVSEARRVAQRAIQLGGEFLQRPHWLEGWPFKHERDRDHFLDGLYKSGVLKNPKAAKSKRSILVLRFSNLSADPSQQYFADGMTLNINSRLARIRALKVMSASHVDTGGQPYTAIASDFEANYLLNGSVQREGDRVRVLVELIDGRDGEIRWSERFDARGNEVMNIQDEIATAVTATLWSFRGTLRGSEYDNLCAKISNDFNAFDYVLKGIHHKEQYTAEEMRKAHACFAKAIELDPECAEAYGWRAWTHIVDVVMGWTSDQKRSIENAIADAQHAISIDPDSEMGHWGLGGALFMNEDPERGFAEYKRALEINPNNPDLMVTLGSDLASIGRFDEGIEYINRGINFNRHPPEWYLWHLGIAHFCANRPEKAIDAFNRMSQQNKDTRIHLASCYACLGYFDKARSTAAELLRFDPDIDFHEIAASHFYYADEALDRLIEGLRLAMGDQSSPKTLKLV